ncbi:hypothetical protein Godav_021431 [Gossypium davidsonii]|uniref:Uncharacterized protein n=2 Tax=Gossypium TaxID=3633 RepID=A0A7J8R6B3_GOSDV|nr:hypothetical protein [Gossypium davidsonii]MBA0644403.1 hypothetical protein [Gossypium klotzschianum]
MAKTLATSGINRMVMFNAWR